MTACLTSPSHGPATAMGVCSKCGEWLRKSRGYGGLRRHESRPPLPRDLKALRDHFASVQSIGGGGRGKVAS